MDVILIRDGIVENVISADSVERALLFFPDCTAIERTADISFVGPGYLYDGSAFTAPLEPEPVVNADRRVTKFRFRLRFTAEERAAIEFASRQNTIEAAALRDYIELVALAEWVDLDKPLVRDGIMALVPFGLLTAERAAQILDAPVSDDERPA